MAMKFCPECGKELPKGANACPDCGFVVRPEAVVETTLLNEEPKSAPVIVEPVRDTVPVKKSKNKSPIIIAVIALLLIAAIAIGIVIAQNSKRRAEEEAAAEAARLEEEQRVKEYNEYVERFNDTYHLIIENSILVEECGVLQEKVWSNTLWEKDDDETDKYTKVDGAFREDFNDSINALYEDDEFISKVQSIKENKQTLSSNMGKLKNPPDELKTEYDILNNMYNTHVEFINCVLDPAGKNYQQYHDDFVAKDDNMANAINAMDPYVD